MRALRRFLAMLLTAALLFSAPAAAFAEDGQPFAMTVVVDGNATPVRALQAVRHAVTVDTPGAFVWAGALLCALLLICAAAAVSAGCDVIVTRNAGHFTGSPVPAVSPEDFVAER